MGTVTLATHATGRLVRITCAFTLATQPTDTRVRVWRTNPADGSITRLRLSRGAWVGSSFYVQSGDFPLKSVNAVGGSPIAAPTGGSWSIAFVDTEPPQNTACTYGFEVYDKADSSVKDSGTSAALSTQVNLSSDFFYDLAALGRGTAVNVSEWRETTVEGRSSVGQSVVGSGAVVMSTTDAQPTSSLTIATLTATEAAKVRGMLRQGGPVYALSPQKPASYGYAGPIYFSVTSWSERRPSNLAVEASRIFQLDCQHVTPPGATYGNGPSAQAAVTSWGTLWSTFSVETWSVVNGIDGMPAAYPSGTAK
jgi:hypothetical protein